MVYELFLLCTIFLFNFFCALREFFFSFFPTAIQPHPPTVTFLIRVDPQGQMSLYWAWPGVISLTEVMIQLREAQS